MISFPGGLKAEAQLQPIYARLGLDYIPSHGNFITVRVGKAADVYKKLLRRGVIVRPVGGGYQLPEHLRITVGTRDENQRLLDALDKVLA